MKTDNKIDLSKSIEDAAQCYYQNEYTYLDTPSWSFTVGANWQKEKDKVAVNNFDKLVEALKKTNDEYNYALKLLAEAGGFTYSENHFSISNKELLNSIKQQ